MRRLEGRRIKAQTTCNIAWRASYARSTTLERLNIGLVIAKCLRPGFESENKRIGSCEVESSHWKVSETVSRFMRVVNLDAVQDFHHLEALFMLASPGEDGDNINNLAAVLVARTTT